MSELYDENYIWEKDQAFQLICDLGNWSKDFQSIESLRNLIKELVEIAEIGKMKPDHNYTGCNHKYHYVWLTNDLEGFKCELCGHEDIEI
jgi:hypothetical protein